MLRRPRGAPAAGAAPGCATGRAKIPESLLAPLADAATALASPRSWITANRPDEPGGSGAAGAAAAATATGAAAAGASAAGSSKPAGASSSKATCTWSWWAPSVKNPGAPICHGEPTSVGRIAPLSCAMSDTRSRAAAFPGETGEPSTVAMSIPRPEKWFETEPLDVN